MNLESGQPVTTSETPDYSVPWRFMDNWIGVALLVIVSSYDTSAGRSERSGAERGLAC